MHFTKGRTADANGTKWFACLQVNGKVKARLKVSADIDAAAAIAAAKADPAVAAALEGKQVVKEIYVKGRLVNLAVK